MNRGSGRRLVFHDDRDRIAFVSLLAEIDERFGVEVHAYCIMGNHFHLVVRSGRGEVPAAMQWVSGIFTRSTNRRRGTDGPVFRGRYHSVPVLENSHLLVLARYVHRNPFDLIGDAPLPSYRWSSYPAYLDPDRSEATDWLHTDVLFAGVAPDVPAIRRHVEAAPLAGSQTIGPKRAERSVDRSAGSFGLERAEAMLVRANGIDGTVHRDALVRDVAIALAVDDLRIERSEIACVLAMSKNIQQACCAGNNMRPKKLEGQNREAWLR